MKRLSELYLNYRFVTIHIALTISFIVVSKKKTNITHTHLTQIIRDRKKKERNPYFYVYMIFCLNSRKIQSIEVFDYKNKTRDSKLESADIFLYHTRKKQNALLTLPFSFCLHILHLFILHLLHLNVQKLDLVLHNNSTVLRSLFV